jgi:predicted nucleic acid-binding protein
MLFLDASALVKGYLVEDGDANMDGVMKRANGSVCVSEFVALEVLTALRNAFRGRPKERFTQALDQFWDDYPRRFIVAQVDEPVVKLATDITTQFRDARARSMDVLHVATALKIRADRLADEVTMVTSDNDLAALAKNCGLRTFDPSREPLAALPVRGR